MSLSIIVIISIVTIAYGSLSNDNKELLGTASEYGFEMFVNYFEGGEVSTASTDQLKEMHKVVPKKVSTWIFGDGYFEHPTNPGSYYMHTDVGYSRLIFYSGLIGLFIYIFYQFALVKIANIQTEGRYKVFWIITYVLFLTLMLKGFTDLISLYAPFLCIFQNKIINSDIARN